MFAMLDGEEPAPWLARLKDYLVRCADRVEWTMRPVLDYLQPRLAPERHALLTALANSLNSGAAEGELGQLASWRDTGPVPYNSAGPFEDCDDHLGA
jgi:hypothetical protein